MKAPSALLLAVLLLHARSALGGGPGTDAEPPAPAAPPSALPLDLAVAAAESDTWPEDHGAAVRYAQAAAQAGRHDLALLAWERAEAASGPSLPSLAGRSAALAGLGRAPEAMALARAATRLAPDREEAWDALAWAHRHPPRLGPGTWGSLAAEASYLRALRLDRQDDTARCGLAWTRLSLGDRIGPHRTFRLRLAADPDDACGTAGAGASAPRIAGGGALVASGLLPQGSPTWEGGASVLVQGGIEIADLAFLQASARLLWLLPSASGTPGGRPSGAGPANEAARFDQQELWLRAGLRHRGSGGQILAGFVEESIAAGTAVVIGGQGWVTFGATVRGEGAWSGYEDGIATLGGGGVRVPVTSFLDVDAGFRVSSWSPVSGTKLGPDPSASVAALVHEGRLSLEAGGRFGTEHRPPRFDGPTLWNTQERVTASAWLAGTIAIARALGIAVGYEVLRLDPADGTGVRHTHVLSLGITGQASGDLRR